MSPSRRGPGRDRPGHRDRELEPDGRGPWTVVATNDLFDQTVLTGLGRSEAEQLLENLRCDACDRPVSGVPPWESGVVVSQFVCRHCLATEQEGDSEDRREDRTEVRHEGTEFLLIQQGMEGEVL